MTRKDYAAIARVFREVSIGDYDDDPATPERLREALQAAVTDVFAADNERFDRKQFYAACEETR